MNPRILFSGISTVIGLTTLVGVLFQKHHLARLRSEQQSLIAPYETTVETRSPARSDTPRVAGPRATASPSLELLHLRSEVNRLTNRRRELAVARSENGRLRVQFAASRTNISPANALPPGYVRKSDARFVGYNTPADTIQSLLWAIQRHDITNMAEAFTPEEARQLQEEAQRSGVEAFFKDASILPGMHIKSQQQMPDGSLELEVEVVPGQPLPDRMRFRQINGQWKLDSH
jgi:hypothetical protein